MCSKACIKRIIDLSKRKWRIYFCSVSEDSGIMQVWNRNNLSEDLSIAFTETLYEKLSAYYIEKTVSKEQQTYDLSKTKADSLSSHC